MKYLMTYEDIDWIEDFEEEDSDNNISYGMSREFYSNLIGKRVRIKPCTRYYHKGTHGVIIDISSGYSGYFSANGWFIRVRWDNKAIGLYNPKDLILV